MSSRGTAWNGPRTNASRVQTLPTARARGYAAVQDRCRAPRDVPRGSPREARTCLAAIRRTGTARVFEVRNLGAWFFAGTLSLVRQRITCRPIVQEARRVPILQCATHVWNRRPSNGSRGSRSATQAVGALGAVRAAHAARPRSACTDCSGTHLRARDLRSMPAFWAPSVSVSCPPCRANEALSTTVAMPCLRLPDPSGAEATLAVSTYMRGSSYQPVTATAANGSFAIAPDHRSALSGSASWTTVASLTRSANPGATRRTV